MERTLLSVAFDLDFALDPDSDLAPDTNRDSTVEERRFSAA